MKVLTILGTRPEIIRLSRVIPRLDDALGPENHILVNTGQNYDASLNANFFAELGLRSPDHSLKATGTLGAQLAVIMPEVESVILHEHPDCVLILGDTNSSLAAIMAARMGIPVYHMEAGNRSYSSRSPEEVNRRLIDHASTVLLPYTERSRQNLLAEGIHSSRIFVTGNPIHEVMSHYNTEIAVSDIHVCLSLSHRGYFLVTLHREENVDDSKRLEYFLTALELLWKKYSMPVIVSTHPRTRSKLSGTYQAGSPVRFLEPFGFFDFIALQRSAFCVLTDSGTVQEESCLLQVPSVILRDATERPETIECGASMLSGADPQRIIALVKQAVSPSTPWRIPEEYTRTNVSDTVVRILTSHFERNCQ